MGERKTVVLSIDDNAQQLREFKAFLVPKYDLRVVKSASEAMNFLNHNESDVILLDIEMPNIDGFEFLKDIRKIPSYVGVPIIIVSGNKDTGFFEKAKSSSASDVLTKPVRAADLINAIENVLAKGK